MPGKIFTLSLIFLFLTGQAYSQYEGKHSVSFESLISSGDNLPFWLIHNQSGKYGDASNAVQLLELQSHNRLNRVFNSGIDLELGVNIAVPYSSSFDVHANELYAGIHFWKLFKVEGGSFREENFIDGLSSTNMNIDRTLNARPYPKIRIATDGFINPFSSGERISFKAEYDEGFLNDNRVVMGAHLHHKSFYMKVKLKGETHLTAGVNHFVMWGGTHPIYGELPGFGSYLRYILGRKGDDEFLDTDQINVAGNQLGSYYLQLDADKPAYNLTFYLSHPFEDKSGAKLKNWRDNLIGVFIHLKRKGFLEKAVYEFMHTRHQSGDNGQSGHDNYYNNGVYNSGYTYQGYTISSPLFSPLRMENGIVTGIDNNRIIMNHIGLMGSASTFLAWDARLTFSRNQGTYSAPYDPAKNQFSSLLKFHYFSPKLPVELLVSLAADLGKLYPNRFGAMFSVSKAF